MAYDGGKAGAGVYQTIINQIPPHHTYIEPFLGDGAIMRHKKPAGRNVGVEIDGPVRDAFKCDVVPQPELYACDGIEWLRHEFGFYRRLPESAICATEPGSSSGARNSDSAGQDAGSCVGRRSHNVAPLAIAASNGGSAGTRDRALEYSGQFVYADPPYPLSTRRNGAKMYRHEFSDDDHLKLLGTLKSLPCMVAVSSYWSEMYAEHLRDWRSIRFPAQTRQGMAEEVLWMNFPLPEILHDSQYLGRNKRERERIRRRVRNWSAGLTRMEPLERQAIMDVITGR